MKVEKTTVSKMLITGAKALDPITVYAEDLALGKGKITIVCYGKSFSSYWGAMGDQTIEQFFSGCDQHYIAENLSQIPSQITNGEIIKDEAFREIVSMRRKRDLDQDSARELWDKVDSESFSGDGWSHPALLQEVFGNEWWYRLPTRPNPDYQYLCRIIVAVQEAFALQAVPVPA